MSPPMAEFPGAVVVLAVGEGATHRCCKQHVTQCTSTELLQASCNTSTVHNSRYLLKLPSNVLFQLTDRIPI